MHQALAAEAESPDKKLYREHSATEPDVPLFARAWWLDAVCGASNWDAVIVQEDGVVLGSMPYYFRTRLGMRLLTLPPLTQTLGPWIAPLANRSANKLGKEKKILEGLIARLPPFDHFLQTWHYRRTNWLPFYWAGFKQTTLYTYVLTKLDDESQLWAGLQSRTRNEIRKAERAGLNTRHDLTVDDFLALSRKTFAHQGLDQPFTDHFVRELDVACVKQGCRSIIIAEDPDGRRHAGVYIVWDENSAYYLMGGADPELRSSGATSLCLWEGIKRACKVTTSFDFEGSMVESIEHFFRAFGGTQTPYFSITKTPSRLLRIRQALSAVRS